MSVNFALGETTVLILCGGVGTRMGGRQKPLIPWGDRTLVETIANNFASKTHEVMLSISSNTEEGLYANFGFRMTRDHRADVGPLAGIESGLRECDTPFLFVCPGDAPFASPDITTTLGSHIDDSSVAVAHDGKRQQNLFCLIRTGGDETLSHYLDTGARSVSNYLKMIGAVSVVFENSELFTNLNTPGDLKEFGISYP